ncbi:MAG TPA: PaaI family thioesterase [Anaerolineales bacterium]|nr:PaaI family thioesterase [Anaerolineales bacterium]
MGNGVKQPNSHACFVCGLANPIGLQIRFYSQGPDEVSAEYSVPENYQGYPGVVHGGIVAAMLDEICARALMAGNHPRFMYTARLEARYRKNVPVGQPLRLVGRALKAKSHTASAHGAIYNADGELLAEAEALLVDLPAEMIAEDKVEALGWRVYDD